MTGSWHLQTRNFTDSNVSKEGSKVAMLCSRKKARGMKEGRKKKKEIKKKQVLFQVFHWKSVIRFVKKPRD
jgi:hypothetical protein